MITEHIKFKNDKKITLFSPIYEYNIFGGYISDIDLNALAQLILKQKESFSQDYEYKSLNNEISTDFPKFHKIGINILKLDYPEIKNLFNNIKFFYREAIKTFNIKYDVPLKIQCWASVMNSGQEIKLHSHVQPSEYAYLSGNLTIQCENSQTIYVNPIHCIANEHDLFVKPEKYYIHNHPGRINIFQSDIPHYTTKHQGNKERITVAFDIVPAHFIENKKHYEKHFIDFEPL